MNTKTRWLAPVLGLILLGLATSAADARPGGGHSYSGGSSHSSSSGSSHSYSSSSHSSGSSSWGSSSRSSSPSYGSSHSSSSGSSYSGPSRPVDAWTLLAIFGVLGIVIVGVGVQHWMEQNGNSPPTYYDSAPSPPPQRRPIRVYEQLRAHDPEFSAVVFEDFVYALYARVHAARHHADEMQALVPYVAETTRQTLLRREPSGVRIHGVVIGRMQAVRVNIKDNIRVDIEFEANYTAELPGGPQGYYVTETWSLERGLAVRSRAPDAVFSFHCPACGAPFEESGAGVCARCGNRCDDGRFDWTLTYVKLGHQESRPPALTGDVQEQGTNLPTVVDNNLRSQHAALVAEDPNASAAHIERRLHDIYSALNTAWTARDLRTIRPHVSDALYNYLAYWIDAYKAQDLRNQLEEMEISRVQIVKLTWDKYFTAVTLRFWASGLDYTLNHGGTTVSGSCRKKRVYSEYWTLIRGAAVRGAPKEPAKCPNCGAPLDRVNMAGNCEYCDAHLTRGEFDWVLSKIEQDESYLG